jgi:hypothetical protein
MTEQVIVRSFTLTREEIAEKYVRDCLVITDGSAEKGLTRIGQERFEETVRKVLKALPLPLKKAGK